MSDKYKTHLRCEKRERRANERSDDCERRKGRRRMLKIRIHEIALNESISWLLVRRERNRSHHERVEDQRNRKTDEHGAQCRDPPRHLRELSRPTKPEDGNDKARSGNHRTKKPALGRRVALPLDEKLVLPTQLPEVDDRGKKRADADKEEDEPGLSDGKVARHREDDRERLKQRVQAAVDQADVECHEQKNGFADEHREGP